VSQEKGMSVIWKRANAGKSRSPRQPQLSRPHHHHLPWPGSSRAARTKDRDGVSSSEMVERAAAARRQHAVPLVCGWNTPKPPQPPPPPPREPGDRAQPYPVGGGDADDELDGVPHVEAAVPPHHQRGLLPLARRHGGQDALDEVLGVVGIALEDRHPLAQPAGTGFLVAVGLGLHRHDPHHGRPLPRVPGGRGGRRGGETPEPAPPPRPPLKGTAGSGGPCPPQPQG